MKMIIALVLALLAPAVATAGPNTYTRLEPEPPPQTPREAFVETFRSLESRMFLHLSELYPRSEVDEGWRDPARQREWRAEAFERQEDVFAGATEAAARVAFENHEIGAAAAEFARAPLEADRGDWAAAVVLGGAFGAVSGVRAVARVGPALLKLRTPSAVRLLSPGSMRMATFGAGFAGGNLNLESSVIRKDGRIGTQFGVSYNLRY